MSSTNMTIIDCEPFSDDPASHSVTVTIFAVCYTTIFILGLAGNLSVIIATVRHRSLQTVQNIFILNLAASDVVVCLLSLPITPVNYMFKRWYFGSILCRLFPSIQAVSIFIATFSLCAIAVDRYFRLVVCPGRPLRRINAIRITYAIWAISLTLTMPYVWHMKLVEYKGYCGYYCSEQWPNAASRRIYTIIVLAFQFIIPFSIMAFCYRSLFAFLRQRAHTRLHAINQQVNVLLLLAATAGGNHSEQLAHLIEQKRRLNQQKRRVTMILVSMVVIFGITWLPHNLLSLAIEYDSEYTMFTMNDIDYSFLLNLFTHCMAMTSAVANPIQYAFLNPEFRQLIIESMQWAPFVSKSFVPTQSEACFISSSMIYWRHQQSL